VQLQGLAGSGWVGLEVSAGYRDAGRGVGVADLALTPAGQEPRADGRLAYHVLDVMESLLRAAQGGGSVAVESTVDRPAAVPLQSLAAG
jgi:hypothetical protein